MAEQPILWEPSFAPSPDGHGGQHRSLQLHEILLGGGLPPSPLVDEARRPRMIRLADGALHFLRGRHPLAHARELVGALGYQSERVRATLEGWKGARVLAWERTHNRLLGPVARRAGLRVVALPQNLESLVAGQPDPLVQQKTAAAFETELRALAAADAVFTISREEQWLLGLRGIAAEYLPYHPAPSLRERLLALRSARAATPPSRFLVLGTAHNLPTAAGMREQLDWLERVSPLPVDVAGFGTDKLARASTRLKIHGAVSPEQLTALLTSAKALLLHQRPTTGAVTRIAEMLVAGIPVIANVFAARSAWEIEGVRWYEHEDELAALLERELPVPPAPPPPVAAEQRLLSVLRSMAGL